MKPVLLDLFCGAGGASMGYHQAGFDVVGVDIDPQPDYPFEFVQADALAFLRREIRRVRDGLGTGFAAVHASPPCQDRIAITAGNRRRPGWSDTHVNLVPDVRRHLVRWRESTGTPAVIECGVGRHLRRDVSLCGEMFGLAVLRHRWFEIDGLTVAQPPHVPHRGRVAGFRHGEWFEGPYFAVYGDGGGKGSVAQWQAAMQIDWTVSRRSIAESIPPAYSRWLGERLIEHLSAGSPVQTVLDLGRAA